MCGELDSIGLGLSFYRDWKPAVESAGDFAGRLGELVGRVPLLVEVDLERRDRLDGGLGVGEVLEKFGRQGWREVRAWTRETAGRVAEEWPDGLVNPFDLEFSFGGIHAKVQALGKGAGCGYVARFDPGCRAPEDLMGALGRHQKRIEAGEADVVAGVYDGRLAIRTDFVVEERQEELFRTVERYTRVNPREQIIGGALYTCRVECPPPPPLGGEGRVAIVFSDDGFMGTVLGERAVIDRGTVVGRSKAGFAVGSHEYRVRLALMGALDRLWEGEGEREAARWAVAFYREVGELVADWGDVDVDGAERAVEAQVGGIARGVARYREVRGKWGECVEVAGRILA